MSLIISITRIRNLSQIEKNTVFPRHTLKPVKVIEGPSKAPVAQHAAGVRCRQNTNLQIPSGRDLALSDNILLGCEL